MRDKLVHHPNSSIRETLAEHSTDKHRHAMLDNNESNGMVQVTIAGHGNSSIHDRLLKHKNPSVRMTVAKYGKFHHSAALLDDDYVKREAQRAVAKHVENMNHSQLKDHKDHPHEFVHRMVERKINDNKKLDDLLDEIKDNPLMK